MIGDVPYGAAAAARYPDLIAHINRDPLVRRAVHVGDTKNGSTHCTDAWFTFIADGVASFEDPVVYTPGDDEWTDCHRDNNGNYDPLERLAKIREVYFSTPGWTLGGQRKRVDAQDGVPENTMWGESRVILAAIHLVGSNNNRAAWTCYLPFGAGCPDGNAPSRPARWVSSSSPTGTCGTRRTCRRERTSRGTSWVRLRIDPRDPAVFSWEVVTVP